MAGAGSAASRPLQGLDPEHWELLRAEAFPDWVEPMKATLVDEYFSSPDWVFERKLDGYRILAYVQDGQAELYSRNQNSYSSLFPEVAHALTGIDGSLVLDGEVVAWKGRESTFSMLQDRLGIDTLEEAWATGIPIRYYLFDVLHVDGYSTRSLPLLARKSLLKSLLPWKTPLHYTVHKPRHGVKLLDQACGVGWEGLIAKNIHAPYVGRRSDMWLKFKCSREQEFVIVGYTEPQGARESFGALLLGYYEGTQLHYAGKVGTGFDYKELADLHAKMAPLERTDPPTVGEPRVAGAHWLKPKLVAQVAFTEWTPDGRLRHPRYLGLRSDKKAREVVREEGR